MMKETHTSRSQKKTAVEMAIAAVEGNPNPLDMDLESTDPAPTSLDLPEKEYQQVSTIPRGRPSALGRCRACGAPLSPRGC
jgi:hypothetical protein